VPGESVRRPQVRSVISSPGGRTERPEFRTGSFAGFGDTDAVTSCSITEPIPKPWAEGAPLLQRCIRNDPHWIVKGSLGGADVTDYNEERDGPISPGCGAIRRL
jgi:hypothetical protein